MKKETYDKLKKYEKIFYTAINANYYRAMDSRFAADFINACGEEGIYVNQSCPACVLLALQKIGKIWLNYKPEEIITPETPKEKDNKPIKPKKEVTQKASKGRQK